MQTTITKRFLKQKPKRLFRKQKVQGLLSLPVQERDRIAEAVHRAVCDVRGVDAPGGCQQYALAGLALVGVVTETLPVIQAGSLTILHSPVGDDGGREAVVIDASRGGYERGEAHLWLATSDTLIDFSARHFKSIVSMLGRKWENPAPPPAYVWRPLRAEQKDFAYMPDPSACISAWEGCHEALRAGWGEWLGKLAIEYYYQQ